MADNVKTVCHVCEGYEYAPAKFIPQEQRVEFDDYCITGNGTDPISGNPSAVKCREKNDGRCTDFSLRSIEADPRSAWNKLIYLGLALFGLLVVLLIALAEQAH